MGIRICYIAFKKWCVIFIWSSVINAIATSSKPNHISAHTHTLPTLVCDGSKTMPKHGKIANEYEIYYTFHDTDNSLCGFQKREMLQSPNKWRARFNSMWTSGGSLNKMFSTHSHRRRVWTELADAFQYGAIIASICFSYMLMPK